jgi:hypothetical protein
MASWLRRIAIAAAVALVSLPPGASAQFLRAPAANAEVDLELVLAVDVSGSVDIGESRLQRQGYIDAFLNPKLLQTILNGRHGRIAVTYLEWAGWGLFRQMVDWTVIHDRASAEAFARELDTFGNISGRGTSISGAIDISLQLFAMNPFKGDRRVIDISGDGPNNSGLSVVGYRDMAVERGITINGLPILSDAGNVVSDLDVYYKECVVGGPGAFVIPAQNFETFGEAVLRKMILEVADARPEERSGLLHKAQFLGPRANPLQNTEPTRYFPNCDIPNRAAPMQFPGPGGF